MDQNNDELIFRAIRFNQPKELTTLLSQHPPSIVNTLQVESSSLLMLAVQSESYDCVKVLVNDFNADILFSPNDDDFNALTFAIAEESPIIDYFLSFDTFHDGLSKFCNPLYLRKKTETGLPLLNFLATRNFKLFSTIITHITSQLATNDDTTTTNNNTPIPALRQYNLDYVDVTNNTILTHLIENRHLDQQRAEHLIFDVLLTKFSINLNLCNVGKHGSVLQDLLVAFPNRFLSVFTHYPFITVDWLTFKSKTFPRSLLEYIMSSITSLPPPQPSQSQSQQPPELFSPLLSHINQIAQMIEFQDDSTFLAESILPSLYKLHHDFELKSKQVNKLSLQLQQEQEQQQQEATTTTTTSRTDFDRHSRQLQDIINKMNILQVQFPEALTSFQFYLQFISQYIHLAKDQQDTIAQAPNLLHNLCTSILTLIHRTTNPKTNWNIFYLPHPATKLQILHLGAIGKNYLLCKLLMYYGIDPLQPINNDGATILHVPEMLSSVQTLQWFLNELNQPGALFRPTLSGVTPMMIAILHLETCRESIDYIFQQYSANSVSSSSPGASSASPTNPAMLPSGNVGSSGGGNPSGNTNSTTSTSTNLFTAGIDKDSFLDLLLSPTSPIKASDLWSYIGLSEDLPLSELMFHSLFARSAQRLSFLLETSPTPISLEVVNEQGDTLLLHCIRMGYFETISWLLQQRANLYAINSKTNLNALGTLAVYQFEHITSAQYEQVLCQLTGHYSTSPSSLLTPSTTIPADFDVTQGTVHFTLQQLHKRVITETNLGAISTTYEKVKKSLKLPPGITDLNYDGLWTSVVSSNLYKELMDWGTNFRFDRVVAYCYLGADIHNAILPYVPSATHKKLYGWVQLCLLALLDLNLNEPVALFSTTYKATLLSSASKSSKNANDRYQHGIAIINQVFDCLRLFLSLFIPMSIPYAAPFLPKAYSAVFTTALHHQPANATTQQRQKHEQELYQMASHILVSQYHGNNPLPSHGVTVHDQSHRLALTGFFGAGKRAAFISPCDALGVALSYNNPWLFKHTDVVANQLHEQLVPLRTEFLQIVKLFASIDHYYRENVNQYQAHAPSNYSALMKFETNLHFIFPQHDLGLIKLLSHFEFTPVQIKAWPGAKFLPQTLDHFFHFKSINHSIHTTTTTNNSSTSTSSSSSTTTPGKTNKSSSTASKSSATKFAFVNDVDDTTTTKTASSSKKGLSNNISDPNNDLLTSSKQLAKKQAAAANSFNDLSDFSSSKTSTSTTTTTTTTPAATATTKKKDDYDIDDLQSLFG